VCRGDGECGLQRGAPRNRRRYQLPSFLLLLLLLLLGALLCCRFHLRSWVIRDNLSRCWYSVQSRSCRSPLFAIAADLQHAAGRQQPLHPLLLPLGGRQPGARVAVCCRQPPPTLVRVP
jgi:hypothetical protein